jgi:hypothetical protein
MLTIINRIRTLLIDTHLLEELWIKLIKTVVYLRNRSLTESDKSTDSRPNNLNKKKSNKENTSQNKSESKNNLANDNAVKARRIRNLKKF